MDVQWAEQRRQIALLGLGDLLVEEEQHLMFKQRRFDSGMCHRIERLRQIDPADDRTDGRSDGGDGQRHVTLHTNLARWISPRLSK